MKLNELLKDNNTLLSTWKTQFDTEYTSIFSTVDVQYLDDLLRALHGNKTLNTLIDYKIESVETTQEVLNYIATIIHNNIDRLTKTKTVFNTEYDFMYTGKEIYTENITDNTSNEYENTQENINKDYGYDTETGVNNDSSHLTDSNSSTIEHSMIKETERKTINGYQSKKIDDELKRLVKNDSYIVLQLQNIVNNITISLYE